MHIAWLGKKSPFCGNVTYGLSTTEALRQRGHAVSFIHFDTPTPSLGRPEAGAGELDPPDGPEANPEVALPYLVKSQMYTIPSPGAQRELRESLERLRPDLVHASLTLSPSTSACPTSASSWVCPWSPPSIPLRRRPAQPHRRHPAAHLPALRPLPGEVRPGDRVLRAAGRGAGAPGGAARAAGGDPQRGRHRHLGAGRPRRRIRPGPAAAQGGRPPRLPLHGAGGHREERRGAAEGLAAGAPPGMRAGDRGGRAAALLAAERHGA